MNALLRNNQKKAIEYSVNTDFESGVHFHATGTGKSWIALQLILEYHRKNPRDNILWMCEQKSILIEQFNEEKIKEKGFQEILDIFTILNYTEKKPRAWYNEVNNNRINNKPFLLVINRSFLVSQKKYQKIDANIGLIIHDECHSIKNKTTGVFYQYILEKYKNVSCLGFSATPFLEKKPFDKVLTNYTIYDAFLDNIILPPKICWINSNKKLADIDFIKICQYHIKKLHYQKIIVWCGIIDKCYQLAELWKEKFPDFYIALDTSKDSNDQFQIYSKKKEKSILFCACKHREGSDILNLDCCIFLDKVENRNPKTFVQCIGRVLRKDKENNKKFGLILDFKASSCIKVCDRMNQYLNCKNSFPWDYSYKYASIGKKKKMLLHQLILTKQHQTKPEKNLDFSLQDILERFVLPCPKETIYQERLAKELALIESKKLGNYLYKATEILKMTNYIPHVTRGSCGSSLVCYLLGISNVDPVKNKISFARFLNQYRDTLPDIDFDFPHYLRDEVFLKLQLKWPNQVARISNHVYWQKKSSLREAIRKVGIRKQISKEDIHKFVKSLPLEKRAKIKKYQQELEGTFSHYSLHCGGIVFFHQGIPEDLVLNTNTLSQILYDKKDISKIKQFKIDILSSKGISQLIDIVGKHVDFSDCPYDEKTYQLLQNGENIGITLSESPLMRKALLKIKPKSIDDIATCLAIIRPAAKDARIQNNEIDYQTQFIYDDDAITILSKTLNIDEDLADKYRRYLAKGKWKKKDKSEFQSLLQTIPVQQQNKLLKKLANLRQYGFCKSHSYSYAQLVYKIAYCKAHRPRRFWLSTLKNASSSYRKWVHIYEAFRNGVDVDTILNKKNDCSIYAENRRRKFYGLSEEEQLKRYGYWTMKKNHFFPNCYFYEKNGAYYFSGLIASLRVLDWKKKIIVCFLGVKPGIFIEIITKGSYYSSKHYGVKGRATIKDKKENSYNAYISKYY